jgi:hypothetical protein
MPEARKRAVINRPTAHASPTQAAARGWLRNMRMQSHQWEKFPDWEELIRLGFGVNGVIRDENHPVYRDLLGHGRAASDDEI